MRLVARRRILHDGRAYAPGEALDVPATVAETLLAAGAVERVAEADEEPPRARRRRER